MPVPKILHFVWVGDKSKRPDGCIESWRRLNPDYEVIVWGNDALVETDWVNKAHMSDMFDHELCGVADLMRYEILYACGGIALDADSYAVRPLQDWVVEPDDFTCWSNERYLGGLLANGIMGAVPKSDYIKAIIADIASRLTVTDDRAWKTTGPMVTTRVWHETGWPLTVWPAHLFLPDFHSGDDYNGRGPIFARQFYGSTYNGLRTTGDAYDQISAIGR